MPFFYWDMIHLQPIETKLKQAVQEIQATG